MASSVLVLGLALLSLFCSHTYAADPGPLQDFCVAINKNSPVFVNGFTCKDPNQVGADDFFFTGLNVSGDTRNEVRSKITFVTVNELPGLNTLGIAMVRIDYAPYDVNPPHIHPRASEILTVLEGTLLAGFVTSNPDHRLMSKILHAGDVFTFPHGLIHFQQNIGQGNAVAHASFNSQYPGVITIANATFGSKPPISDDILARALQVEKEIIDLLKAQYQAQFLGSM